MIASWLEERDRERRREASEKQRQYQDDWRKGWKEGWREGWQEGQEKRDQEWRAWYERLQAAHREGREFNEPPPEKPVNGNGA